VVSLLLVRSCSLRLALLRVRVDLDSSSESQRNSCIVIDDDVKLSETARNGLCFVLISASGFLHVEISGQKS
jgi:hypothetical protein